MRNRRARRRRLRLAGDPAAQRHRQRGLPVGEGLIDHVGVGLGFEGTERLQRETAEFERSHPLAMAQVTIAVASSACAAGLWDLFLFPALDPPGPAGYEISVAVFAMKPASRGSVRLTRAIRARRCRSTTASSRTPRRDVLAEGVEPIRALAASDAVRRYAAARRALGRRSTRAPRARGGARLLPPVGTCAIGAVVDGDGRVYGYDGPSVADASVMPTIPRANTNLSHPRGGRADRRADARRQLTSRSSGQTTRRTRAKAPRWRRSGGVGTRCGGHGSSGTPSLAAGAPARASSRWSELPVALVV